MESIINKYSGKMISAGLAQAGAPLVALLDADVEWNRQDTKRNILEQVMGNLHINSLIFSIPSEPYRTIIEYLAQSSASAIFPEDSETRTFFHDFPVCRKMSAPELIIALKHRKNVIVPGAGIVATGSISPLQAYASFSTVCFSCFVKFFTDYLREHRNGTVGKKLEGAFTKVINLLEPPHNPPPLMTGPFSDPDDIISAISEAGRATVKSRLVDSFFGNISYLASNILYISQTASSLDELNGNIDSVPLDGSSSVGITASSEYSAHRLIVENTSYRAILHGHPKFSVILSLDCALNDCEFRGSCHISCPQKREVEGIPIVTGEIGRGLAKTVPAAIAQEPSVIVYGHGVFTAGKTDFNLPLQRMAAVENSCRTEYFRRAGISSSGQSRV
jgi:ribulose-5-phosphate 4-epimerase/fuculose-1-phosphate aldolase